MPPPLPFLPASMPIVLPSGLLWPCAMRLSTRAKRARLRVQAGGQTELVLPAAEALKEKDIKELLQQLTPWFVRTLNKQHSPARQEQLASELTEALTAKEEGHEVAPHVLPSSLGLPLTGAVWHIFLKPSEGKPRLIARSLSAPPPALPPRAHSPIPTEDKANTALLEQEMGQLILSGEVHRTGACCLLLQRWLTRHSAPLLEARLRALAQKLGLGTHAGKGDMWGRGSIELRHVRVRAMHGRWGSCSSRGDITLNSRLMLLPAHLAEHVMLHELCHLKHMNHSQHYRNYLATIAPAWREREKALNAAWKNLPPWVILRA